MFQEFNRFFVEAVYGNFRYSAKLCWAPYGLSTNTDSIWHLYFCQKSVFVPWLCLTQLYGRWDLSRWSTLGSVSPKYDGIRSFSIWWILTVSDFRCAWFPGPNTSVGGSLNWYIASRWGGRRFTGFLFAFFHQPRRFFGLEKLSLYHYRAADIASWWRAENGYDRETPVSCPLVSFSSFPSWSHLRWPA